MKDESREFHPGGTFEHQDPAVLEVHLSILSTEALSPPRHKHVWIKCSVISGSSIQPLPNSSVMALFLN